jgi:RHH-type rel operon transcriptional repressor/antitoxin RelB
MLDLKLPAEIEKRLDDLAERVGMSKHDVARDAILAHLEEMEDLYLARQALQKGGEPIPLETLMREFGLDEEG